MTTPNSPSGSGPSLQIFPVGTSANPDLWTEVPERVQARLAEMESELRRRIPEVAVTPGRTKGERFYLFSYRSFTTLGSGLDPVVCGVTFAPADGGVSIGAEISGEGTGDVISKLPAKTVANAREAILAEGAELARRLAVSAAAAAVAGAIKDARRGVP